MCIHSVVDFSIQDELRPGSCPRGVYAIARGDDQVSFFCFPALFSFGFLRMQLGLEFGIDSDSALAARVHQHLRQPQCRVARPECNPDLDNRKHHNVHRIRCVGGNSTGLRIDDGCAAGVHCPDLHAQLFGAEWVNLKDDHACPCPRGGRLHCKPCRSGACGQTSGPAEKTDRFSFVSTKSDEARLPFQQLMEIVYAYSQRVS